MRAYKFCIDYYADNDRNHLKDLAYRRLIDLYYKTEEQLTKDIRELSRLINMPEHEKEIESVLTDFFDKTGRGYRHNIIEKDLLPHKSKKAIEDEFNKLWQYYPKRAGTNPKGAALRAYRKARKQHSFEEITDGLVRYRKYCCGSYIFGTEFVMQARTFFGPDLHWQDEY